MDLKGSFRCLGVCGVVFRGVDAIAAVTEGEEMDASTVAIGPAGGVFPDPGPSIVSNSLLVTPGRPLIRR
jgi:hypothetical protein